MISSQVHKSLLWGSFFFVSFLFSPFSTIFTVSCTSFQFISLPRVWATLVVKLTGEHVNVVAVRRFLHPSIAGKGFWGFGITVLLPQYCSSLWLWVVFISVPSFSQGREPRLLKHWLLVVSSVWWRLIIHCADGYQILKSYLLAQQFLFLLSPRMSLLGCFSARNKRQGQKGEMKSLYGL